MKSKIFSLILVMNFLFGSLSLRAQEEGGSSGGFLDSTMRDLTVVLGAGAAGAILGLSTLSFVETPKDHFKNVAIGGAIGIVIGVGVVVYTQATTQTLSQKTWEAPMNAEKVATLARHEFLEQKIAADYLEIPTFTYKIEF